MRLDSAVLLPSECGPESAASCLEYPQVEDMRADQSSKEVSADKNAKIARVNTDANQLDIGKSPGAKLPDLQLTSASEFQQSLKEAHDQLVAKERTTFTSLQAISQFEASMKQFEERAYKQGLAPDVVQATYASLNEILSSPGTTPLNSAQKEMVVEQFMNHLANPFDVKTSVQQGWHSTCPWALLEMRLTALEPDKIAKLLTEVVNTGQVSTAQGTAVQLDATSLAPDDESKNIPPRDINRDYASQLIQVTLDSIRWQAQTVDPQNRKVEPGSLHYEQLEHVLRPPVNGDESTQDSGERVWEMVDGKKVVFSDNEHGFGGAASSQEVVGTEALVVGHKVTPWLFTQGDSVLASTGVKSSQELSADLLYLQGQGMLPAGLEVNVRNSPLADIYLERHKDLAQAPDSWHFVAVTKVAMGQDGRCMLTLDNPWGIIMQVSAETAFHLMTPVTEEQTARVRQLA